MESHKVWLWKGSVFHRVKVYMRNRHAQLSDGFHCSILAQRSKVTAWVTAMTQLISIQYTLIQTQASVTRQSKLRALATLLKKWHEAVMSSNVSSMQNVLCLQVKGCTPSVPTNKLACVNGSTRQDWGNSTMRRRAASSSSCGRFVAPMTSTRSWGAWTHYGTWCKVRSNWMGWGYILVAGNSIKLNQELRLQSTTCLHASHGVNHMDTIQ